MSDTVIKVENLSKLYRLGKIGTGTFAHDVNRWWYKVRGKEDPYMKVGEVNDRTAKGNSNFVWSLQDINFEIKQGEAVGIIGRNGAGKSTLLKLLSRTTRPTTGSIKIKGRVASLLEVGTGFHPELTGRENIFLNGAILGMTKKEIRRKFDEIVDFSGVERYIDTPVKRYSSGMYVRLAFGVAAHLEPEILIVDEVLAVGDAEFQRKALGKMQDVSQGQGRTVLFVSHNMGIIRKLCNSGIYLDRGLIKKTGAITDVISSYMEKSQSTNLVYSGENNPELPICVTRVSLNRNERELIDVRDQLLFEVEYVVNKPVKKHSIALRLQKDGQTICTDFVQNKQYGHVLDTEIGKFKAITTNFPKGLLKAGWYSLDVLTGVLRTSPIQSLEGVINFELDLVSGNNYESPFSKDRPGIIALNLDWVTSSIN